MNSTNYPTKDHLPKFFVVEAHDGEGNPRNVKYINEDALAMFSIRVRTALQEMEKYTLIGGDDKHTDQGH